MLQLVLLATFTLVLETLIVAHTIAIADRKKGLSALFSMLIEPIKIISLLVVIESANRYIAIVVVMIACGIGSYLTIYVVEKVRKRRKKLGP